MKNQHIIKLKSENTMSNPLDKVFFYMSGIRARVGHILHQNVNRMRIIETSIFSY